jgi:hypothetical protein
VNWEANVVLAKGLAKHGLEATDRAAVSRAYYGAFNSCRRWLEANVTPIDNRGAHQQVWMTFKLAESAAPAAQARWRLIGNLGDSLHMLRNQVDYDDRVEELGGRTQGAVSTAERIFQLLAELGVSSEHQ